MRTTCKCPTTKLASFIFKEKGLSQASLKLSSSRGVFGSLENKGKRRKKGENQTLTKATRLYLQKENCAKKLLRVTKWGGGGGRGGGGGGGGVGGGGGAYIGHPMYENTIKPNILAKLRDKRAIHQNEVGLH